MKKRRQEVLKEEWRLKNEEKKTRNSEGRSAQALKKFWRKRPPLLAAANFCWYEDWRDRREHWEGRRVTPAIAWVNFANAVHTASLSSFLSFSAEWTGEKMKKEVRRRPAAAMLELTLLMQSTASLLSFLSFSAEWRLKRRRKRRGREEGPCLS